ncbi:MAG: T9SS type A sorting domain-containing protein [Ignavibacteria bacterium]
MKKFYIYLLLLLSVTSFSIAKPRVTIVSNPYNMSPGTVVLQRIVLNINNIAAYFQNTGIFDQNTTSGNTAGLEWPKGSGRTACFTAGLSIGCGINGQYAQVMASYKGEYAPGHYKADRTWETTGDFKMYTVRIGDNATSNPDYANWYKMVPYGAPYKDVNNNHQYDDGIDIPGMINSGQTIFECMGDGDVSQRSPGEGFGGGINNPLLGAEIHFTSWSYTTPGLEDLQFINYVVLNKGLYPWDSTFMGVVVDPDLGDANDDYIGCDVNLNLGYCYNGDNNDPIYGQSPPAFGMDYFKSPINRTTGDTLGLTSFVFFTNTGSNPIPCEADPNGEPIGAYNMLQGLKKDRAPFLDPTVTPPAPTRFVYPGDPESGTGWTEYKGSVQNCGGLTGTTLTTNPTGDRRFIFNSGALDFKVSPGDTQNIVLAQFVARGSSNLNSVTRLKSLSKTAQTIYEMNFNVIQPPPVPVVSQSVIPINQNSCALNIYWNDAAESYNYWDTIFYQRNDSNLYKFEGYEIYELSKNITNYPDFSKPLTIDPSQVKLLQIFDLRNNIGLVIDTLSTGTIVNNNEVYAPFPIVPPFNMTVPTGFPNRGLSRLLKITNTLFPENYGGNSQIQYGQTYKFVVNAYAVSTSGHIRRGFKVIRNKMATVTFNEIPHPNPSDITFNLYNGDTLNTNMRDMCLTPVVVDQQSVQDAKYRVIFSSDTTYRIQKSLNNGTSYTTLKSGLKVTGFNTVSHEDSRIVDGILLNTQKIRFTGSNGQYTGNVGVVKDVTLSPDSIQTRNKGWGWSNPGNPFLTGSKFYGPNSGNRPYQSVSQSLSYPTTFTFSGIRSGLLPQNLRKVTIQWTAPGQGQYAYYYQDSLTTNDRSYMFKGIRPVPFKVFADTLIVENASIPSFRWERRQVNCAFVESADINPFTETWNPTTDSLGGKLLLYTFGSSYDTNITTPYKNRNLYLLQSQFDIMYVWAPKLVSLGGKGNAGEEFYIYPYNVTRPYYNGTAPLYYEFTTVAPIPVITINNEIPKKNDLLQNYPNPFNPETRIKFAITEKSLVTVKVYNIIGQLVKTLINNKSLDAGTHLTTFNGNGLSSGIYFYMIKTEKYTQTKRMVLVK